MPGTGTHRADQRGQHGKGKRSPSVILNDVAISPHEPNGSNPLNNAGNVNDPSRDRKSVHRVFSQLNQEAKRGTAEG